MSQLGRVNDEQIQSVAGLVTAYIRQQRDRFFVIGRHLTSEEQQRLQPFFGTELLERARIHQLRRGELPNPSFYTSLRQLGFEDLPDFAHMAAVTFIDAIAFGEEVTLSVLFHELVHVVQYSLLGADEFAMLYVRGFISGGDYEGIPLEKNAYELDSRFNANPEEAFDVVDEVKRWNESGRF